MKTKLSLFASFDHAHNVLTVSTKTGEPVYTVRCVGAELNVRVYPTTLGHGMAIRPEAANAVDIGLRELTCATQTPRRKA